MLLSSTKSNSKHAKFIKDFNDINLNFPNQIAKSKDDTNIYDLNKWDEEHLYPIKQIKTLKIEARVSSFFESSSLEKLKYNNQIVNKMAGIKVFQENKYIRDLRKTIQEMNSNVIAKNIKINRKHFNFDAFRQTTSSTISNSTNTTNTPNHTATNSKLKGELDQIGNEIQLREDPMMKDKDSINANRDIKISNHTLEVNNLPIEGNYEMVFSNEYYKSILKNKKSSEKIYHRELNEIINQLQAKQKQISDLQKEQTQLHEQCEEKRMRYAECKDVSDVVEKDYSKASINQASFKNGQWKKRQSLVNQLKLIELDYLEIQKKSEGRLEEIRKSISELKAEISSLYKYKEHNLKCLIEYYLELLSKGIDVREIGLVWVIIRLAELNVNLTRSNFPNFLDNISIKYLIEESKKSLQVKQLKKIMRVLKIKYKKEYEMNNIATTTHEIAATQRNKNIILFGKNSYHIESNLPAHLLIKMKQNEMNELMMRKWQIRFGFDKVMIENQHQTYRSNDGLINKYMDSYTKDLPGKISNQAVNDLTFLRNMITKSENEIHIMKSKYLQYFKSKYEHMKSKGIRECVRYDLMFSALFGNYAIV